MEKNNPEILSSKFYYVRGAPPSYTPRFCDSSQLVIGYYWLTGVTSTIGSSSEKITKKKCTHYFNVYFLKIQKKISSKFEEKKFR